VCYGSAIIISVFGPESYGIKGTIDLKDLATYTKKERFSAVYRNRVIRTSNGIAILTYLIGEHRQEYIFHRDCIFLGSP